MQEVYYIGLNSFDGEMAQCHFAKTYFKSNHTGEKCWNGVFTVKLDVSLVGNFKKGELVKIGANYGSQES
jgi:hypothetical protein